VTEMVVFTLIGTDTDKYVYETMINYITCREIKKVHSVWLKFWTFLTIF